ncbi:MAG: hypothetical protein AB7H97_01490 [Pseudobdellovibrionaceae bacterium]
MEITSFEQICSEAVIRPRWFRYPRVNTEGLRIGFFAIFSVSVSTTLFLMFLSYAEAHGIKLENGCEGPGVPFGMLSGVLFALFLRIEASFQYSVKI